MAVASMLACSRIGATHSVIFAGFSSKAISSRIQDMKAVAVITANEGTVSPQNWLIFRTGKNIANCEIKQTVVNYNFGTVQNSNVTFLGFFSLKKMPFWYIYYKR